MGTFVTDGATVLPPTKSDVRPATVPAAADEWSADDANKVRTALLDLRTYAQGFQTGFANPNSAAVTATGSVTARALQDRFADVVNVKDYGAVCNGTTNDSTAVQAAIDASGGKPVVFPAGTCVCNVSITASGTVLVGSGKGTILKAASNASPVIDITATVATGQIRGVRVSNLKIQGTGSAGEGIHIEAFAPYVVEGGHFQNLFFSDLGTHINMVCDGNVQETYQNTFVNMNGEKASGDAFVNMGVYNVWTSVRAALNSGTRAFYDKGWNATVVGLDTDGVIRVDGAFASYTGVAIETIYDTGPGAGGAIQIAGVGNTFSDVTLTNVAHTKANYGIEVFGSVTGTSINNLKLVAIANDDAHRPRYPLALGSGSTGSVHHARGSYAPTFSVEAAHSAAILAGWSFSGMLSGVSAQTGTWLTQSNVIEGNADDGASAVGVVITNRNTLATSGAKIASFKTGVAGSEVAYVDKDGNGVFQGYTYTANGLAPTTATNAAIVGRAADGATAIGIKLTNANALTTDGAKIAAFCSDGGSTERASVNALGGLVPGAPTAAWTAPAIYFGSGAPNNSYGGNGSFYFRTDGTAAGKTTLYHKEGGSWVAVVP